MTMIPTITPAEQIGALGRLQTPEGNLPLAAVDVATRIDGLDACTTVTQVFRNTATVPLEATYVFPLPDRGAVIRFTARLGDRTIDGVLRERDRARQEYDEAVAAGHRAAIAEQERSDVFSVRVGNIAPGERAEIELDLVGPLAIDGDEATFRFPLVVAPRYMPGAVLDGMPAGDGIAEDTDLVPDASRISPPVLLPGQRSPVRLSLSVDVDAAGLAVHDLASSLHVIRTDERDGRISVRLLPGDRLDRDFVLRMRVGSGVLQTVAQVQPDADGDEATLTVTVVPPAADPAAPARPRDVVVLLDRSGSMSGWKMTAARRAAARIVDGLTSADRVAVLAFDHEVDHDTQASRLDPATDRHRFAATSFLSGLEARGGTEMLSALEAAASLLGTGDGTRARTLVLVTDGHVGDEDRIVAIMRSTLADATLHVVGIDRAVAAGLLNRLARLGSGAGHAEMVESQDRLDNALDRIRARIAEPVLRGLALAVEGAELVADSLVPVGRLSCSAGVPLVLRARLRGVDGSPVRVRLSGIDAGGGHWSAVVDARTAAAGAAQGPLWAREHLWHLEDRWLTQHDHADALRERMTEQSLRFGVLCRFTAFLAVDRSEKVGDGRPVSVMQPVEAPSGWEMDMGLPVSFSAGSPLRAQIAHSMASALAPGPSYLRESGAPGLPDVDGLLEIRERIHRVLYAIIAALDYLDRAALLPAAADLEVLAEELDEAAGDQRELARELRALAVICADPRSDSVAIATQCLVVVEAAGDDAGVGQRVRRRRFWDA